MLSFYSLKNLLERKRQVMHVDVEWIFEFQAVNFLSLHSSPCASGWKARSFGRRLDELAGSGKREIEMVKAEMRKNLKAEMKK